MAICSPKSAPIDERHQEAQINRSLTGTGPEPVLAERSKDLAGNHGLLWFPAPTVSWSSEMPIVSYHDPDLSGALTAEDVLGTRCPVTITSMPLLARQRDAWQKGIDNRTGVHERPRTPCHQDQDLNTWARAKVRCCRARRAMRQLATRRQAACAFTLRRARSRALARCSPATTRRWAWRCWKSIASSCASLDIAWAPTQVGASIEAAHLPSSAQLHPARPRPSGVSCSLSSSASRRAVPISTDRRDFFR